MAGDTIVTIVGNLTADPELRFTASGVAVTSFTVASTPRKFNRQTNAWEDEQALFMRCTIWRQAAENVAESLTKGTRVVVTGRLQQRSFDTREGEKRTVIELQADEVAPSLKYATATVNRAARSEGGSSPSHDDPWGQPPPAMPANRQGGGWGSGGFSDEPPF